MVRAKQFVAMSLLTLGLLLTACGSGSGSGGSQHVASVNNVVSYSADKVPVATVGGVPITRGAVSHWMEALAGSDYHELSHEHTLPEGLVSDPPGYKRCVSQLESVAAAAPPSKAAIPNAVSLLSKCREIYGAMREQAMNFLVNAQWLTNAFREWGITVSEAEVEKLFNSEKAEKFPTEAALSSYLDARRLTLADEMQMVKLQLIAQKGLKKIEAGGQQGYATFLKYGDLWVAKTHCNPGYVVEHCHGYEASKGYKGNSAAVLMEKVAALATGLCINLAACAKR